MKCQCCKEVEAMWAWQCFGPSPNPVCYSLAGSHYRGFPVIKVCYVCKMAFENNEYPVSFEYKGTKYIGENRTVTAIDDSTIYPDFESAQEALDRGETVRIAVDPYRIDPRLLQLAQDFQDKERLEAWKRSQSS